MSDHDHQRQGLSCQRGYAVVLLLLFALTAGLTGCGKKAVRLEPPDDVEDDTFPLTYPDPATDPKPTVDPRPDLAPQAPPAPERF